MAPPDAELFALLERLAKMRDSGALSRADHDWLNRAVRYLPPVYAQAREAGKLAKAVYDGRKLWDAGYEKGALKAVRFRRNRSGRPGPRDREVIALLCDVVNGARAVYVDRAKMERLGNPALGVVVNPGDESPFVPLIDGMEGLEIPVAGLCGCEGKPCSVPEALAVLERVFGWEPGEGWRHADRAKRRLKKSSDPVEREIAARCPKLGSNPDWKAGPP